MPDGDLQVHRGPGREGKLARTTRSSTELRGRRRPSTRCSVRSGISGRARKTGRSRRSTTTWAWLTAEPGRFSPASGALHAAGNSQTLRGVGGHEPVFEPRVCWRRRAVSGRKRSRKPWKASARRKRCEAVSCAVSLDGVSLRPDGEEEACWREASCGTVSFHDAEGNRLKTLSFGAGGWQGDAEGATRRRGRPPKYGPT